jgi:hypothetical protein
MILAHKLAGFLAAHALWSACKGEQLIPTYGFVDENGERQMDRLVADSLVGAVTLGGQRLSQNAEGAARAGFVFSGSLPIGKGEYDALIVELRAYSKPSAKVVLAIPYSPKTNSTAFRIHKLKIVEWSNCDDFDKDACLSTILKGSRITIRVSSFGAPALTAPFEMEANQELFSKNVLSPPLSANMN